MGVEYYFRGFLAITLVQQLSILVQIFVDSDSLQRAYLQQSVTKRSFRPYAALFFVNSLHQLILKAILQCSFNNSALHIVHALSSLIYFAFFVLEVFVYEYFQQSTASFAQIVFSGLTVLLTVVFWSSIVTSDEQEPAERESRPRKLIARHYMETQIPDFETDPKRMKKC